MKKTFLLFCLCITHTVIAQIYDEEVVTKACECVYNSTDDNIDAVINSCIMKALLHSLEKDGISQEAILKDVAKKKNLETQAVFSEYQEMLYRKCFAIQSLIEKKAKRYSNLSDSADANRYYQEGVAYMKHDSLSLALGYFNRALAHDSLFVAALDSAGIIYFRQGMPDAAIEYCQRSLQIFAEGYTALENLAKCYLLNGESQESFKIYAKLIKYFAKDPEGYFGMGSISFLNEDYPTAARLMKYAYDLYAGKNAGRAEESKDYYLKIAYYYMKEAGQDSLFLSIAGEEFIPPIYRPEQFSQLQYLKLNNEIESRLMESQILICADYILSTPVNTADKNRTYAIDAVKRWMSATPDYTYRVEKNVSPILDKEGQVMSVFITAMVKFSIENPSKGNDKQAVSWYAWNTVLDYASNPANTIKMTGDLKKMIKAKKEGTLAKQLGYK